MSRALRIGVFVVFALLILATGIFLIGNKDFLFSKTYRLESDFPNVAGLVEGADVRVGGIHEGTVKQIKLPSQPDGKVTVVMDLHTDTQNILRQDSVASIKTDGLLGNKYVEISFGSMKGAPVESGALIKSETPTDMTQQAQAIAADARGGIDAFRDDMQALQHNFLLKGFFKDRGYDDTADLKKNSIPRLPSGSSTKEFDYQADKLFDKGESAKLKDKKSLEEAGRYLSDNKFNLAVISAAEATGDTAKDRVLTEARAKVVRDYLVQNFKLDDTRLKTIGLGKPKGGADSNSVQILVYGARPDEPRQQAANP